MFYHQPPQNSFSTLLCSAGIWLLWTTSPGFLIAHHCLGFGKEATLLGDWIRAKRELGYGFLPPAVFLFQTTVLTTSGPIHHKNSHHPPFLLELSLSSLNTSFSPYPKGNDFCCLSLETSNSSCCFNSTQTSSYCPFITSLQLNHVGVILFHDRSLIQTIKRGSEQSSV